MCTGMPPELLQAILRQLQPSLNDWAALRSVCKAWRTAASLDLVEEPTLDQTEAERVNWHSLRDLRKLDLHALVSSAPTVCVLTELKWRVEFWVPDAIYSSEWVNLASPSLQRLHVLRNLLSRGAPFVRLPVGGLPELVELQFSSDTGCAYHWLQTEAMPRLKYLQLETAEGADLPDFRPFAQLQRLCLVTRYLNHSHTADHFRVAARVQVQLVTGSRHLTSLLTQAAAHTNCQLTMFYLAPEAITHPTQLWAVLNDAVAQSAVPASQRQQRLFADSALRPTLPVNMPVTWLSCPDLLQQAITSTIWRSELPGSKFWP